MRRLVPLILLCLIPVRAEALVIATELTFGSTVNSSSGVTASISPTNGALLILVQTIRKNSCITPTVTGLGTTWTVRDSQSLISNLFVHSLWTTVSNGTSGTITLGYTGTCDNIAWDVIQFTGITTTVNNGYVTSSHTNLTSCSPCPLTEIWSAYSNPTNIQVSSCMANSAGGGSSMTKDPDTGWVQGTNVVTGTGALGDRLALGVQWLITRGSDTAADCIMTGLAGAANPSMILTAEFTAFLGAVHHRVHQQ